MEFVFCLKDGGGKSGNPSGMMAKATTSVLGYGSLHSIGGIDGT